jgi:hypothetical protein
MGIQLLPFCHNGVERTEILLAKLQTQNFRKKIIFKTEDNMPAGK